MSAWKELKTLAAYVPALRGYLRRPITRAEAMRRVSSGLDRREDGFVDLLERAVFSNPRSPYRRLFEHAGIEPPDAARLVRDEGLETALRRFYDAGVRLTIGELRGRDPLRRGSLELAVRSEDFDNPLAAAHFETQSGGSRSAGTVVNVDLAMNEYAAGYSALFHEAYGLWDRPLSIWFPTAPATTGLRMLLTFAKVGIRAERWFSQSPILRGGFAKQAVLTETTVALSRLSRNPLPAPRHTPPERADRIAHWLADSKQHGRPAVLVAPSGSAVRVCVAARERGLDISGSFFRLGAEPYTAGRAEAIAGAGCRAGINYYMAELGGFIGVGCGAPIELDEVHLLLDKLAVVQRDRQVGDGSVGVLAYTTLNELCPKILINFESDDYGVLSERHCGCPLDRAGFSLHLHGIRSHEKLTSEGITFAGSDVITLVEEVFPRRFGGSATDFQLVEEEQAGGSSTISIVVDPRLGSVDPDAVVETALSYLRSRGRSEAMMAEIWRTSGALRVVRRVPYVTAGAKIPVLHTLGRREAD